MTHEYFTVDCVINEKISRPNPMNIAGHKFRFVKVNPKLLNFGIIEDGLKYSDPAKTILDLIYIWRYNGMSEEKIIADVEDYAGDISRKKIKRYVTNYPKSVLRVVENL